MDRNGGDRAAILTMAAMLMVFALSIAGVATLDNPAGPLRAGMSFLLFIHVVHIRFVEARPLVVVPPPPPPPLGPAAPPPHLGLGGWNEIDDDNIYRAPPPSLASAYSSTDSGPDSVDAPARQSSLSASSYSSTDSGPDSDLRRGDDVESEGRRSNRRTWRSLFPLFSQRQSSATDSPSRRLTDLSSTDGEVGSRRREPPSSVSTSSSRRRSKSPPPPGRKAASREGGKMSFRARFMRYLRLRLALARRSAFARASRPRRSSSAPPPSDRHLYGRRRHFSGSDSDDPTSADKVHSWMTDGYRRRSPSSRSTSSSSGRRSTKSARGGYQAGRRRSRSRRGAGKRNGCSNLKRIFKGKR